jgi:hypothetical protein
MEFRAVTYILVGMLGLFARPSSCSISLDDSLVTAHAGWYVGRSQESETQGE